MANNLKALREARGISQEHLARLCDVSVGTVSRWERGPIPPNGKNLTRLAKRLAVEVADLGFVEGQPEATP